MNRERILRMGWRLRLEKDLGFGGLWTMRYDATPQSTGLPTIFSPLRLLFTLNFDSLVLNNRISLMISRQSGRRRVARDSPLFPSLIVVIAGGPSDGMSGWQVFILDLYSIVQ